MKKIAFIIVRYGENINDSLQMLAERLLPYYEVEVPTTIRLNHPDQDYTEGVINGHHVHPQAHRPGRDIGPSAKNTRPRAVSGNT